MNNKRNYIIQCTEVRPSGITVVTTVIEYSLLDSFNSYIALTPTQLGGLSDSEYSTRLSDFIDFIGTIDYDTKTQLILDSTYYDPLCVEPLEVINVVVECDAPPTTTTTTTTTTAAPTTTTTTTAAPTTTTTTTEPPFYYYNATFYNCEDCTYFSDGVVKWTSNMLIIGRFYRTVGEFTVQINGLTSPTLEDDTICSAITNSITCIGLPCL